MHAPVSHVVLQNIDHLCHLREDQYTMTVRLEPAMNKYNTWQLRVPVRALVRATEQAGMNSGVNGINRVRYWWNQQHHQPPRGRGWDTTARYRDKKNAKLGNTYMCVHVCKCECSINHCVTHRFAKKRRQQQQETSAASTITKQKASENYGDYAYRDKGSNKTRHSIQKPLDSLSEQAIKHQ